jgi:opacity protein-like surface antigen
MGAFLYAPEVIKQSGTQMKKTYIFVIIFIFIWEHAPAVTKVGTTAAPFLTIGIGARAIGMGGSFVSIANDATAMFWNPSGLSLLQSREVVFIHTNWIADINFQYAGIVTPISGFGTIGVNVTYINLIDEMERTTELEPEGTGETFSANSYAIGLAYARGLTDRFSIGANVKYIRETIFNSVAEGFAIDIGTIFVTPFNGLRLGTSISNFGTKMQMKGKDLAVQKDIDPNSAGNNETVLASLQTDEFDLPLLLRVGISYDVFRSERNFLTVSVDALHPNDNIENVNLGAEYTFNKIFSLRGGYKSLTPGKINGSSKDIASEEGFTLGAGLKYKIFGNTEIKIDYAYEDFGIFNNIQKFSLAISF